MRKLGLFVVAMLALAALGAAPARAGSLAGLWIGYYGYGDSRPAVKFQARLSGADSVTGSTIEANTFGDASALFLTASVRGSASGDGSVHLTKTYDGTGGQVHSVEYNGRFDSAGRCISGAWSLAGASGPFEMCVGAMPGS